MHGVEIELDRRILAQIRDPLVHLLRTPSITASAPRTNAKPRQPPRASLTLSVSQADAGMVEIIVADDGKGIDPDKVQASAIKQGILSDADALSLESRGSNQLYLPIGIVHGKKSSLRFRDAVWDWRSLKKTSATWAGRLLVETELKTGTVFACSCL